MQLDKDHFLVNMNMVELVGKKVLVQPSQVESTKGKDVVIGEEWLSRMIKPKGLKDGQWWKNEGTNCRNAQRPLSTSPWPSTSKEGLASGGAKTGPSKIPNQTVWFP
jgi:hypothetical protein